jgi:hypothetical protein
VAGFPVIDVDSIAAVVTPARTSQSCITRSCSTVVLNVRVWLRRPHGAGVRTQTISAALPATTPADPVTQHRHRDHSPSATR